MSPLEISSENLAWLSAFRAEHGRAPRVLHIGNIANNAYNNARLLNAAGLDCDVVCYNYYHIMGCPEWEEADFDGEITDDFRPDWRTVGLNGYQRPLWFAQGPMELCLNYLLARRCGDSLKAQRLWIELCRENRTEPPEFDDLRPTRCERTLGWHAKALRVPVFLGRRLASLTAGADMRTASIRQSLDLALGEWMLRVHIGKLVREFHVAFPNRSDQLVESDFQGYRHTVPIWRKLFRHYDIIQAYAADPLIPLLARHDYFAFEHGTLREIPFAQTWVGRTTALSYRLARHVFVTNFDCLDNARLLADERVSLINHPYDEDHGLSVRGWEPLRENLCAELDATFLFFFPTRHDWVAGTGYADKANDIFLRAFATLRRGGHRVGLVCCRWGTNVAESTELIARLGCAAHIKWVNPMNTVKFERMAMASHCVADQFKLGAFGGVMFKAMAVGAPICTYLDAALILRQYPELPPAINCRSTDDVVEKLAPLVNAPEQLARIGAASRAWMKYFHRRDAVVNAQIDRYRLDRAAARPWHRSTHRPFASLRAKPLD